MTAKGVERRALLLSYIEAGLGDWGARSKLVDERPDLLPPAKYAANTVQREITKARAAYADAVSGDPAAEYVRGLRRQIQLCESALARNGSPDLANLLHRLGRELALATGVPAPLIAPGGKVKLVTGVAAGTPDTPADPVVAPTPTPATEPAQDAGTTPVDMTQSAALARVQAAWPEIAAEMDRWYPNGQPAKEGG